MIDGSRPARDADGARPRGRRRGRRAGRGRDRASRPATTSCSPSSPPAASASRAWPAAPRSASRAPRRTRPARCSAASAGSITASGTRRSTTTSASRPSPTTSWSRSASAIKVDPELPFELAALFGCAVLTGVGAAVNAARIEPGRERRGLRPRRGRARGAARRGRSRAPGRSSPSTSCPTKLELAQELGATHAVQAGPGRRGGDPRAHRRRRRQGDRDGRQRARAGRGLRGDAPRRHHGHRRPAATRARCSASRPCRLVAEERTLRGSYLGSSVPARDIPRFIELHRQGRLPVDRLLTHRSPLDEINEGFDRLASGEAVRQAVVFD